MMETVEEGKETRRTAVRSPHQPVEIVVFKGVMGLVCSSTLLAVFSDETAIQLYDVTSGQPPTQPFKVIWTDLIANMMLTRDRILLLVGE